MKHVKRLMLSLTLVAGLPVLSPPGAVQAEQKSAVGPLSGGQVVSPQGGANAGYPDDTGGYRDHGPILLKLKPPKSGTNGSSSECKTFGRGVRSALVNRLFRLFFSPLGFYINVQTSEFPDGALRGQII